MLHERHLNIPCIHPNNGDFLPGLGDVKAAREYERKIRNLLHYKNPETKAMAAKVLDAAKHDRHISTRQFRHLEKLFGPEPDHKRDNI